MSAMSTHKDDAEVQLEVCYALGNLASSKGMLCIDLSFHESSKVRFQSRLVLHV
jgi:hypothetical protein